MRHAGKPTILIERAPRLIHVEPDAIICRGWRELVPRRLDTTKLLTTLVRQRSQHLKRLKSCAVIAARPDSGDEGWTRHLWDLGAVSRRAVDASEMFAVLADDALPMDRVVAIAGEGGAYAGAAHERLGASLALHERSGDHGLARAVMAGIAQRAGRLNGLFSEVVAEERPGKALVVDPGEATARQAAKRWQPHAIRKAGEFATYPTETVTGWAACALVLRREADAHARSLNVASRELHFPTASLELDGLDHLAHALVQWLVSDCGLAPSSCAKIVVSIPVPAVADFFMQALSMRLARVDASGLVDVPDLALGWHPAATLLELAATSSLPCAFVDTGRFPQVSFGAFWA